MLDMAAVGSEEMAVDFAAEAGGHKQGFARAAAACQSNLQARVEVFVVGSRQSIAVEVFDLDPCCTYLTISNRGRQGVKWYTKSNAGR